MTAAYIKAVGTHIELTVKVVPGASRDRIVGPLGDALKVQVAAPPERGQANTAVIRILSQALNRPVRHVSIVRGAAAPRKTVRIEGITAETATSLLSNFT